MIMMRPKGKAAAMTKAFLKSLEANKGPRAMPSQKPEEPKAIQRKSRNLRDNLP